ncbi:hypothetical protein CBS101457_000255 [Exobasidium rhododendri]|nr:hypothetical protein CBS101457_000255 [Exobasidium rhododendri]
MNPWDGSQTSRLSSEEAQRLYREQLRQQQQQSHYHGLGGDYATSSSSSSHHDVTYYPNLFGQHPEGIGAHQQRGNDYTYGQFYGAHQGGSSSDFHHQFNNMGLSSDYRPVELAPASASVQAEYTERQYRKYGQEENIWLARNGVARTKLAEIISRRVHLLVPFIREELHRTGLTKSQAQTLRTGNEDAIAQLITTLLPNYPRPAYMSGEDGMSMELCEDLVKRLLKVTHSKEADEVRYALRLSGLDAATLGAYLFADEPHIVHLAQQIGLALHDGVEPKIPYEPEAPQEEYRDPSALPFWVSKLKPETQSKVLSYFMGLYECNYAQVCQYLEQFTVDKHTIKALNSAKAKKSFTSILSSLS